MTVREDSRRLLIVNEEFFFIEPMRYAYLSPVSALFYGKPKAVFVPYGRNKNANQWHYIGR
jgi:hypothetical protein